MQSIRFPHFWRNVLDGHTLPAIGVIKASH
jgi:hypothetical protein